MSDLGTFGGSSSYGYGINDSGWITGSADTAGLTYHAFLYTPFVNPPMSDLGTLGGGPTVKVAASTPRGGSRVENSNSSNGDRAFLYSGSPRH